MKQLICQLVRRGARQFVLNAPWQRALFPKGKSLILWAGPFCNITNVLALKMLADMDFTGAVVSPELAGRDLLDLPRYSPLPLGIVLSGNWPLCLARTRPDNFPENRLFKSPQGEGAWLVATDSCCWVFPNWQLDLTSKRTPLVNSGYRLFFHLREPLFDGLFLKKRPGLWNWETGLA